MTGYLPRQHRAANGIITGILSQMQDHRTRFFSEPAAEGFRVFLNVYDARALDELSTRQGNLFRKSDIEDGDTGTMYGLPFTATNNIRPGVCFVGYCVTAPPVDDDGSRW